MEKINRSSFKRVISCLLVIAMLISVTPVTAFADSRLETSPPNVPTGARNAEGDIPSENIAYDAPNAVHAFVGVQTGGDANLPLANATGQQFKPIAGVKAYFQWFEDGGYVSPVYSAVSDANGRLNIDCKPYVAADGKIIKFDADPTVSAGHEKYRFWVDHSTIPDEYQLQYITGEQVIFPKGILTITQGGSGSNTAKNTHENWKILLMQKPKAEMHKKAEATQAQANGGYIKGKVSWDYNSAAGGAAWKYIAHQTTPAQGVTVKASYLSDYAMKKIYSDEMAVKLSLSSPSKIRGSGWTSRLEGQLQDEIKKQMKGEEDKWIAETVSAVTNSEGDYTLQFNGTWGYKQNAAVAQGYTEKAGKWGWTQPALDRLGTVATKASDGSFKDAAWNYNEKHINLDWLFVSTEGTEDLRVMTPYNNNWYAAMNSDWGIHNGWSGASGLKEFSVGVTNAANRSMQSDFVFGINKVNFNITNYDSRANTAIPGDVAETSTTGLPYSNTSDQYRIVWYDEAGKEVKTGPAAQPSTTGTLPSCPLNTETDIPGGVTKTTEFTAKLYRVDKNSKNAELIAVDSFTVEVSHLFISRYDDVNIPNPKANDPEMKGATYSATGLPADLQIASNNGTISGKAKEAGLYKANFRTVLTDPSGQIEGTRDRYITVTDSPLAAGEVGAAYSQDVKPVPEKDQKDRNYIYKVKSVNFISGKEIEGLKVEGDATTGFKITGTPTKEAKATEDVLNGAPGPNVEVTYDIYKTNDAGKEVLVASDHKDKVPLVIEKAKDNTLYEPKYTAVDGKVGTPATVAAPKFLDEKSTTEPKPEANPQPTGMKFALGTGAPEGAVVNADGSVTYTPKAGDEGKPISVPVVVTYSDGTTDNATAVINVADTSAEKITKAGGLAPKATAAFVGDTLDWAGSAVLSDKAKKATNAAELQGLLDKATITDATDPARTSKAAGEFTGKVKVTFEDKSFIEVDKQILYVYENGANKPGKDDNGNDKPLPKDAAKITFTKDDKSIKDWGTVEPIIVKKNAAVPDGKFPKAQAKDGYNTPTWSPAKDTVITGDQTFNASATKQEQTATPTITAPKAGDKTISGTGVPGAKVSITKKNKGGAGQDSPIAQNVLVGNDGKWTANVPDGVNLEEGDTILATQKENGKAESDQAQATVKGKGNTTADMIKSLGGLKGKDFGVWKGTIIGANFWNKGVAPADSITDAANRRTVQEAINAATVTDTTPGRTTGATGNFPGTLKVTFDDGSVYEIKPAQGKTPAETNIGQTLYVKDHIVAENEQNTPDDAIVVKLRLGEGVKAEYKNPITQQVTETINGDKYNPVEHKTYKVKPDTDISTYKLSILNATVFDLIPIKHQPGYTNPVWTPNDKKVTKTNNVFTAKAEKEVIPPTFDKNNITGIEVIKDPTKMIYTEGEKPAYDGIKVKLTDKNGNKVEIGKDQLSAYGVTVTPAEDKGLTVKDNNGKPFVAKVNGKDAKGLAKELTANSKNKITVNPQQSNEDVIPYVPANKTEPTNPNDTNVPTTDKDGKTVDKTKYDIVAFKVTDADKAKGSLTLGDKTEQQVISALVKKGSKWEKVTVPTINVTDSRATKANGYKPSIPAKTKTVENGKVYEAQFVTNGQEITPGTKLPDGVFEVKVARDKTSIKDNALYGKSYAVFKDSKLAQDKFPTPEAADNFKDAKWNVENPWDQAIKANTTFTAKATAKTTEGKTAPPTINEPKAGDKTISGTGVPGAKVSITKENKGGSGQGSPIAQNVLVGDNGKWTANVPDGVNLEEGDTILATQRENGKDESDQVEATVKGKGNTTDSVIPFEPKDPEKPGDKEDENIPTINPEDKKPIKRDEYVVVGFKVDPKDSGTLTLGELRNKTVISALVKKDTEWAKFTMPTTNDGNDYVFWHWNEAPAETVADGQVRVAKFIKSGDELDPNDNNPLPNGFHKVTVTKGTGIAYNALFGKSYGVKKGDTLAKNKFPELKVTDETQYKNPSWNVENPWTVAVAEEDLTFTAIAVSAVFDKNNVTNMEVKTQPDLNYVEGNATKGKLDLSKLVVTLTDKNGNTQDVPFDKLGEYGITANPANGTDMTVDGNNGKPVVLTKGGLTANTDNLVVTKDNTTEEKSEKPIIDQPTEGNDKITGEGKPGAKIVVEDKDGNKIGEAEVNDKGKWEVPVPKDKPLKENDKITVEQTEEGKKPNTDDTTVKGKKAPTPSKPSTPTRPSTPSKPEGGRVHGKDRVETAIEISKKYFRQANTVIVVDSKDFPDAMTASVLSKLLKAPILLTNTHKLDPRVAAEIQRLGAKDVIIVGGNSSVSDAVKRELAKFDKDTVERIYGKDRYETSAQVARRVVGITGKLGHAVVASGQVFADALAVAPYASREGYPILLVKANNLPKSIEDAITELAINKVTIAGGYATVNRSLEASLPTVVERLKGDTRYETAIDIANKKFSSSKEIFLANGVEWMDALVIGPVGGILDMPILLTRANNAPQSLKDYIAKTNIEKVIAIGGTRMVSEKVLNELSK